MEKTARAVEFVVKTWKMCIVQEKPSSTPKVYCVDSRNFHDFSPRSILPVPYLEVHALKTSLFNPVFLEMRASQQGQWLKSPWGK
jgi:hypothetical protein